MSEYLKDLERHKEGEPMPPINLGPYDNPLLWNMLDPYGADRPHQRRPCSVSRTTMELHCVPLIYRDHCVHRYLPFARCLKNVRPMMFGTPACHEFEAAWMMCRQFEKYRSELLKNRFIELTKDYTDDDRKFFPDQQYISWPYAWNSPFWMFVADARTDGWDEKDPNNPMMWREPNRAMMRSEFHPTNFERRMATSVMGFKIVDTEASTEAGLGEWPLSEKNKPKYEEGPAGRV